LLRYGSGYYEEVGYDFNSASGYNSQLLVEAKSYINSTGQYRADYNYNTHATIPNAMDNVTVRNLVVCN
jgi:hypothetical protein